MASAETLPLGSLIAPISESAPAGVNVRLDADPASLYYRIKDARTAARAAERQALSAEAEQAPTADWSGVLEWAPKLLTEQAKDLEVAAWLIEALTRSEGFAGMRDGFALVRAWVERYWDALHPMPDEDGLETRVAPLAGLSGDESEGTLIIPISLIPITAAVDQGGPYSSWHYQQATVLERITDSEQREQRIAAGTPTLEIFRHAALAAGAEYYVQLREDLAQCRAEFAALNQALGERCGHQAPSSSRISEALERAEEIVHTISREMVVAEPVDAPSSDAPAAAGGAVADAQAAAREAGGPPRTREQALRALKEVADYYRRAEPHSPIAYLVEQAVRWGALPLHELIEELIPDTSSRATYHMLTGIRPPPPA